MAQVLSAKSHRQVLSATILMGDDVVNPRGEDLGKIEELIIDFGEGGRVAYAVLSFGGFLGMGDKLFAIPWESSPSTQLRSDLSST